MLTISKEFQLNPPLITTLKCFKGKTFHAKEGLPHPYIMVSKKWSALLEDIGSFIDFLKDNPVSDPKKEGKLLAEINKKYKHNLYLGTELIEDLTHNLRLCFFETKAERKANKAKYLERWTRHPTIACNQIKHNSNVMISVCGLYKFGTVLGYGVCHYDSDNIAINTDVHPNKRPHSFGMDIRKILVNIYLIADAADRKIKECFPQSIPENFDIDNNRFMDQIDKASTFSPIVFDGYKSKDIAILKIKDGTLEVSENGGIVLPNGGGTIATVHSGDGRTKTFPFF